MSVDRQKTSYDTRCCAAEMARARPHPEHLANGDEQRFSGVHYAISFTKGLDHDPHTGLVADPEHFMAFRQAIDDGNIDDFNNRVPVPECEDGRRKWEAPTAGLVYDLEGPDCQAVTMAPAPAMGSEELAFEMAEVYELALLRDVPFTEFATGGGTALDATLARLNSYAYATDGFPVRPRVSEGGNLTAQTAFRGSSPGVEVGPYLSQLMLVGNNQLGGTGTVSDGNIGYGALKISQKVAQAKAGDDYMQSWNTWLEVQQGCDVNAGGAGQEFISNADRFITTPRDLATYVHYDALYEAYLNACLVLLGMGTPFDPGFATLSGMRKSYPSGAEMVGRPANVGGFALYGGPHILTLVTEVATRALKSARYQKFNTHIRARPEVLAARVHKAAAIDEKFPQACGEFTAFREQIQDTVTAIEAFNPRNGCALLPMAFKEGSPMHPAYAAGHASVAGACVTVLKAFFDTGTVLSDRGGDVAFRHAQNGDAAKAYVPSADGHTLVDAPIDCPLTLEGELNKLAANISIGRNMAGVHYYSDYYDSLRMGEEIAIGMLEEQALCYPTDPFTMSLRTFDGDTVRIGAR